MSLAFVKRKMSTNPRSFTIEMVIFERNEFFENIKTFRKNRLFTIDMFIDTRLYCSFHTAKPCHSKLLDSKLPHFQKDHSRP